MLEILGVPFSAHTRKVIVAAIAKELPHRVTPVVPLDPPPGFAELSPLGKIPVLRDGGLVVADSSVICQYLERRSPTHPIYPESAADLARALWIEEYVDGGLAPHVLHDVLLERVFAPAFFGRAPDRGRIERALGSAIPRALAYLEGQAGGGGYLVGDTLSIADITVASMLVNLSYAGERLSEERYPRLAAHLRLTTAHPAFARALRGELPAAADIPGLDVASVRALVE